MTDIRDVLKTPAERYAQMSGFNEKWIAFTEFVRIPKTLSKLTVKVLREYPLKYTRIFVKAKFLAQKQITATSQNIQ
jgi:hypothetical protein